jgi:hypothetical protein
MTTKSGEDADRFARADPPVEARPGGRGADDGQARARGGIGRADRIAVHRRGVEGRLGAGGDHVAGEDAAGGLRERHVLGAEGSEEGEEAGVRLGDREQGHQGAS